MSKRAQSKPKNNQDTPTFKGGGGVTTQPDHQLKKRHFPGLNDHLRPLLDRLTSKGVSRSLQETTIESIVQRLIFGESFDNDDFWSQDGHPNRSTYKKWRRDDEEFVKVLEDAKTAGLKWRTAQNSSQVELGYSLLQESVPDVALALIAKALTATNEFAAIQAQVEVLNRASERTAPKGQTAVNLPGLESAIERIYGQAKEETAEEKKD